MLNHIKPKSSFIRNVFLLTIGTILAQSISIAVAPVLTRIYSPSDFGLFALYMGFVSLVSVVATGRYELSIILPKYNKDSKHIVSLSIIFVLFTSLISLFGLIVYDVFSDFVLIFYSIPLIVIFISINNIFDKYNNRLKNYKLMSIQRLIKVLVESAISISLAVAFALETGLIVGAVCGYFVSLIVMFYVNFKSFKNDSYKVNQSKMKALAIKYINFPKYNMPHALLNTFSGNIAIFLIPVFYGNVTLGLYAFGLKMVQAPLGLLSGSIFNVLAQKMAESHINRRKIKGMVLKVFYKLVLISALMIPFFIIIDDLFSFVFGERWREAGKYIQVLSPWIILVFIASPFSTIPQIYNKQKKAFIVEIITVCLKVLAMIYGGVYLSIEYTLTLLMVISSISIIYVLSWYYKMINDNSYKIL